MIGRTHAASGWCAGLAMAPAVGMGDIDSALVFASVTTGAALLPDIDHPKAIISRSIGPITGLVSRAFRGLSGTMYRTTRTDKDGRGEGTHRFLTHTLIFSLILGGLVSAVTALGDWVAVAVVALLMVLLAAKALGEWVLFVALGAAAIVLVNDPVNTLESMSVVLGVAVTLGCVVHILGDWLTEAPVPMLWPAPIQGRRWYPCNAPAWVRFPTGKKFETAVVFPVFTVLGVLLEPGVWAILIDLVTLPFIAAA